jgi:pimeloyl-ACP methyl ester carboxylesterase
VNEVQWQYRQGGNSNSEEAVIIIPSIAESTNSMFLITPGLISEGFRVIIVSIPSYTEVSKFLTGFDLLTAKMRLSEIHLVGMGFGGFLALHIAGFRHLSAHVRSLAMISSYLNGQCFGKKSGLFSRLSGKARLAEELEIDKVPPTLVPGVRFVLRDMESLSSLVAANRLHMRAGGLAAAIPPSMPEGSVLIVHCLDWELKIPPEAVPHAVIKGQTVALLKTGGILAHLASPDKLLEYMKIHLGKWRMTVDKNDSEEDEMDGY